ncbi:uncharacterized protein LOC123298591 [Chrysoperla carnea]|uniref:uncharacterized protein LOC123298591 n=1 Tax=Chrysoperla carnea TaxID=189513 RepID=UPI001D09851C|nr:uncharacterized protein LOC123298591 [Chrysoperla carnea]
MAQRGSLAFIQSLYQDPYRWSLIKSVGLFLLGIRVAQECTGLELLPGGSQSISSMPPL